MKSTKQPRNLVRFEFSLQRQQSLDAFLRKRTGKKQDHFTLNDVMDIDLARDILLEQFNIVFDNVYAYALPLTEMRDNELELLLASKGFTTDKHAQLYYFVNKSIKIGIQGTLQEIREQYSDSTYRSYKKGIEALLQELGDIKGETPYLVQYLRQKHEQFDLILKK
jgi:hypothetical protein